MAVIVSWARGLDGSTLVAFLHSATASLKSTARTAVLLMNPKLMRSSLYVASSIAMVPIIVPITSC